MPPAMYGPSEVERLTGIPMNTLRAWERRYGVPKPTRGPGGHRVYSESELQALQWIRKQLNAGVSISHAIANLKAQQPASPNMHPEALVTELLAACLQFDERRAEKILSDAFAFHTLERVCVEVLTPALHELGRRWAEGRCTVAAEHFTSSLIQAQLYAMLRTLPAPPNRPLFFVACAPGELHGLAPLMFTVLMRRSGWRALYFGPNLPLEDLSVVVPDLKPDVLVLSVTIAEHLEVLQDQLTLLGQTGQAPPVVLGGAALSGREPTASQLRCHYLGDDMLGAIAKLDDLVTKLRLEPR